MRLSAASLAWIVAFSGCHHPVSPPMIPATRQSHWVLSADAEPDEAVCVEWTVDVDAGDCRVFSRIPVATARRIVRGQRSAE